MRRVILVAGLAAAAFATGGGLGVWLGAAVAAVAFFALDAEAQRARAETLRGTAIGLGGGLVIGVVSGMALPADPAWAFGRIALALGFAWAGASAGSRFVGRALDRSAEGVAQSAETTGAARTQAKILDTSVIIDGRIVEIAETGFLGGTFVVPQFVLRELQQVADSSDPLKRNRGRRGLDMLQRLQKGALPVEIVDRDFPSIREVDLKLIELSIETGAAIVTNDFNLNKVAQVRGVKILNVNDLSNCLRPVVLPGEPMSVFVSKEGKEAGQGVGYLDDGTMVVVEGGRGALGRTVDVVVSTVLQTAAGKMIFVKWPEAAADDLARRETRPMKGRAQAERSEAKPAEGAHLPPTVEILRPASGENR